MTPNGTGPPGNARPPKPTAARPPRPERPAKPSKATTTAPNAAKVAERPEKPVAHRPAKPVAARPEKPSKALVAKVDSPESRDDQLEKAEREADYGNESPEEQLKRLDPNFMTSYDLSMNMKVGLVVGGVVVLGAIIGIATTLGGDSEAVAPPERPVPPTFVCGSAAREIQFQNAVRDQISEALNATDGDLGSQFVFEEGLNCLPPKMFEGLTDEELEQFKATVTNLNFENIGLGNVDPEAFAVRDGNLPIRQINMNNNFLGGLDISAFRNLPELEVLIIEDTRLVTITATVPGDLPNLDTLQLQRNLDMISLPTALQRFGAIRVFQAADNTNLAEVEDGFFSGMELDSIVLSDSLVADGDENEAQFRARTGIADDVSLNGFSEI